MSHQDEPQPTQQHERERQSVDDWPSNPNEATHLWRAAGPTGRVSDPAQRSEGFAGPDQITGPGSGAGAFGSPAADSGRDSTSIIHVGMVLDELYQITRKLGQGGMGVVWEVWNLQARARRALKVITAEHAQDKEEYHRFVREAEVMQRLNHPHCVQLFSTKLRRDMAYLEMEYLDGVPLSALLQRGEVLPPRRVGRLLEQLGSALECAHGQGIVHRDLKPNNLMLLAGRPAEEDYLKILDFGLARILEDIETASLKTNGFLGTPAYASPEQFGNDSGSQWIVDARSDLYSIGVILYECLVGVRPFLGAPIQLMRHHLTTKPPPFQVTRPQTPAMPAVEAVVMHCLAKNPADRYKDVRELVDAFQHALQYGSAAPPRDSAANALSPYMLVLQGGAQGTLLRLRPPIIQLGRAPDNTFQLVESSISRKHAQIHFHSPEELYLTDLNSDNGTYLNDRQLEPNTPKLLNPEDRIQIGAVLVLEFLLMTQDQAERLVASTRMQAQASEDNAPRA